MLFKEYQQCREDINLLGETALDYTMGNIDIALGKIYRFKDTVLYRELLEREGLELSERFHVVANFINAAKHFGKVSNEGIGKMAKFVIYVGDMGHKYGLLK